jgi:hypothetical protein
MISRRPNKRESRENAPGPRKTSVAIVIARCRPSTNSNDCNPRSAAGTVNPHPPDSVRSFGCFGGRRGASAAVAVNLVQRPLSLNSLRLFCLILNSLKRMTLQKAPGPMLADDRGDRHLTTKASKSVFATSLKGVFIAAHSDSESKSVANLKVITVV